jgi:hypothetical protein
MTRAITRSSFARRLSRLEARVTSPKPSPFVSIVGPLLWPQAGERIVVDQFRESRGVTWGRERVAIQLEDVGRSCHAGGYLEDVLREVHSQCRWRAREEGCRLCRGTAVAGVVSEEV